jgi:hypothetical protein
MRLIDPEANVNKKMQNDAEKCTEKNREIIDSTFPPCYDPARCRTGRVLERGHEGTRTIVFQEP